MFLKRFLLPYRQVTPEESDFFDLLRGASALIVFIHHLFYFIWQPHFDARLFNGVIQDSSAIVGAWSVMLFFILSGFMITSSIYRNAHRFSFSGFDAKKFIGDRLYRLYPPLIFSLLLVLVVYFVVTGFDLHGQQNFLISGDTQSPIDPVRLDPFVFLGNALFLQNIDQAIPKLNMNMPLWSLSLEFWYYAMAMLLALSLFSKNKLIYSVLFILFLMLIAQFSNAFFFVCGSVIWFSGALLAILYQTRIIYSPLVKLGLMATILGGVTLGIFCYSADKSSMFYYVRRFPIGLAFAGYIGIVLAYSSAKVKKTRRNAFYIKSAKYSYTLYIIHWPILVLIYSLFHPLMHDSLLLRIEVTLFAFISIIWLASKSAYYFEDRVKVESILKMTGRRLVRGPALK